MAELESRLQQLPPEKRELLELLLYQQGADTSAGVAAAAAAAVRTGPASFSQERMWILHQFDPSSALYNVPGALELVGTLDLAALHRMFGSLIARHEALRTSFSWRNGKLTQSVGADGDIRVPLCDLSGLDEASRSRAIASMARQQARRPFSLSSGPLLRVALVRCAPHRHIVVFVIHHIVADGWSASVLVRDMAELYRLHVQGDAPREPGSTRYLDYVARQRASVDAGMIERQVAYWRQKLQGHPPLLELPSDRPRAPTPRHEGAEYLYMFPAELARRVREFSRSRRVTLFVTLVAVFKVLLHRYTGLTDLVVGTSVANRDERTSEELIGCFVDVLALRTRLVADARFSDVLSNVRDTVLEAFANRRVPFELVLERLKIERNASHPPLFQVMFVLQNVPTDVMQLPGLALHPVPLHAGTSRFDLTLEIRDTGTGMKAFVEYDSQLYDESTIAGLLQCYQHLLEGAVSDPGQLIGRLPLQADENRRRPWWPAAGMPASLVCGGKAWSLRQLAQRVGAIAAALRAAPVQAGEQVEICTCDPCDATAATLAAIVVGARPTGTDPRRPRREPLEPLGRPLLLRSAPCELSAADASGDRRSVVLDAVGTLPREATLPSLEGLMLGVLDAQLEPMPTGVPGKLVVRVQPSPGHESAQPESMPGGSLVHTGVTASALPGGRVALLDVGAPLLQGGYRMRGGEVEAVLRRRADVRAVALRQEQADDGSDHVEARIFPAAGHTPDKQEMLAWMQSHLPPYQIPARLAIVGRSAAAPRRSPDAEDDGTSHAQRVLTSLWKEVLRRDKVDVHDNFFALGGDSILSIQICARAREAGLTVHPRQIFERQTIAGVAAALADERPAQPQLRPDGPFPLTPIQSWAIESAGGLIPALYQTALLDVTRELPTSRLRDAVEHLEERHDALRLRFEMSHGRWRQRCDPWRPGAPAFRESASTDPCAATIDAIAAAARAAVDVERGPVYQAVLIRRGPERLDALLVVIHHLAVDAVSWSILLRDLELACATSSALPASGAATWGQWAARSAADARSDAVLAELPFWLGELGRAAPAGIPVDRQRPALARHAPRTLALHGDGHGAAELLAVATQAGVRADDVLLAALAPVLAAWAGQPGVLIDCEHHGRSGCDDLDLAGTVGWFTSLHPFYLAGAAGDDSRSAVEAIRARRAGLRHGGRGFGLLRYANPESARQLAAGPAAQICFNYLGATDAAVAGSSLFRISRDADAAAASEGSHHPHLLSITVSLVGTQVLFLWNYDTGSFEQHTVEALARSFVQRLKELLQAWQGASSAPEPHASISSSEADAAQLQRLLAQHPMVEDVYRLTPTQEGMLLHSLYGKGDTRYVEQFTARLPADLDVEAFRLAWSAVVQAHPVLRTAFAWEGLRHPVQRVHREVAIRIDIEQTDGTLDEDGLEQLLLRDRAEGFDATRPPLMRWRLLRGPQDCRFLWSFHHVLLDGWSMATVLQQVLAGYLRCRAGAAPALRPARAYREFVEWQYRQDKVAAEGHWSRVLKGFRRPTPLPAQRVAPSGLPPGEAARFGEASAIVDDACTAALRAYCRREEITLNTLVQGMWGLLLGRYGASADVVFGATAAGRPAELQGVEEMTGVFINTLPVRVRADSSTSVAQWLRAIQADQSRGRHYEHVPLSHIQAASEVDAGAPLFETILVFENYPVEALVRTGAGLLSDVRLVEHARFPLLLVVVPGDQVCLRAKFDRSRCDDERVRRMLQHLQRLLLACAETPDATPASLQMLSGQEIATLRHWNDTAVHHREQWVHEVFSARAREAGHAVAVADDHRTLTYQELDDRANALASRLVRQGVGPDRLVPLLLQRSVDVVVAILGVLKAGGAYVPMDPSAPAQRLADMVRAVRAPVVLTQSSLAAGVPGGAAQLVLVDVDEEPMVEAGGAVPPARVQADHLAYVLYTSGSTGTPNGVMVTHGGLMNYLAWCVDAYGVAAGAGAPVDSALTFDLTVTSLLAPLMAGRQVRLLPQRRGVEALAQALGEARGFSLVKITPAHLELLNATLAPRAAAGSARLLVIGGEALHERHLDFWRQQAPDVRIVNEYGPTETVVGCCVHTFRAGDLQAGKVPIGRPIANTQMHILDPCLHPVPVGAAGEIYIGGRGVARGYLGNPRLTAQRFLPDPFSTQPGARMYRTGDLGYFDEDGVIHYLGRADRQLKIRGHRVEPAEVEAALLACEDVEQMAVVPSRERGAIELVAFVVLAGKAAPAADLRRQLLRRLPEYMVPGRIHPVPHLPLTPHGKVDHAALLATLKQPGGPLAEPGTGRRRTELVLARIWAEVLGLASVEAEDHFFEIGGHSLLMLPVQKRIAETLGRDVSILDLFRHPTVKALAAMLDGGALDAEPVQVEAGAAPAADTAAVAIVGLAGRFPGADSPAALWDNLRSGVESVRFFSPHEMLAAGVSATLVQHPDYVNASAVVEGVEDFDAAFFGMSQREAEITDPQHRMLLECAQQALDDAACDPDACGLRIGVYASSFMSAYLLHHLAPHPGVMSRTDALQVIVGNDKDFVATRISYKLGLTGPSVGVQTACSSSLVAVHHAVRAIRAGDCEMALAGGVAIRLPQQSGHLFQPDGILSKDGHCRAFAEDASGFVGGSGAGLVVLKRLDLALRDGDNIRAVILGSATNNDGAAKVGFSAPSVAAQADVIRAALRDARVDASSIGYVEAHGTATRHGDPIEVAALAEAFGRSVPASSCGIGSIKSNIGHLDAAAGVAGLIKTVLQLEHRQLVPSLHCEQPSSRIGFGETPFTVNTALRDWDDRGRPRRAGISSFGMGGTNAHVVLQEAPSRTASGAAREWQLLTLSAKTPSALPSMRRRLADFWRQRTDLSIADVAYTLNTGRRRFKYRDCVVARTRDEALACLEGEPAAPAEPASACRDVAFVLTPTATMDLERLWRLYSDEPMFRAALERCGMPSPQPGLPHAGVLASAAGRWAVEFAAASLWLYWGVRPAALFASATGELAAAVLADALPLGRALAALAAMGDAAGLDDETCAMLAASATGRPLTMPVMSCATGAWLRPEDLADPGYWRRLMDARQRHAASRRFAEASAPVLLHIGVLRDRQQLDPELSRLDIVACASDGRDDAAPAVQHLAAQLWLSGVDIDWRSFHAAEKRQRVQLPGYPFERRRHWIEPPRPATPGPRPLGPIDGEGDGAALSAAFNELRWERHPPLALATCHKRRWWCFIDDDLGERLAAHMASEGEAVVCVAPVGGSIPGATAVLADPASADDFQAVLARALAAGTEPLHLVFAWGLNGSAARTAEHSLHGLMQLLSAVSSAPQDGVYLSILTREAQDVTGLEALRPDAAALGALSLNVALEAPGVRCRVIDIDDSVAGLCAALHRELQAEEGAELVALRGRHRWLRRFAAAVVPPLRPGEAGIEAGGVHVLIGGSGRIGRCLARHLVERTSARVAVIGRHQAGRAHGAEILELGADVTDRRAMEGALCEVERTFGRIRGVFFLAGTRVESSLRDLTWERWHEQLRVKAQGLTTLDEVLADRTPDFVFVMSSLASSLGVYGFAAYPAAHAYLEAWVRRRNADAAGAWTLASFDNWQVDEGGPAQSAGHRLARDSGLQALLRLLSARADNNHLLVVSGDMDERLRARQRLLGAVPPADSPAGKPAPPTNRPAHLSRPYRSPLGPDECRLVPIWQEYLGVFPVGADDNFFELGGDSVVALQVLSHANANGLRLAARDLFEYPTIAELAVVGARRDVPLLEQDSVIGEVPLLPVQHWFFEQGLRDPHHWNHAVVTRPSRPAQPALVASRLRQLFAHHDALRARFRRDERGWVQWYEQPAAVEPVHWIDISGLPAARRHSAIAAATEQVQRSLDLGAGPLARCVAFAEGASDFYILIVVHHLVVDAMSWTLLVEDARKLLDGDGDVRLPPKTASVRSWATALLDASAQRMFEQERSLWRSMLSGPRGPLPVDHAVAPEQAVEDTARVSVIELDAHTTRSLLQASANAPQLRADGVLLAILAEALYRWGALDAVLVELEALGRNWQPDAPEVSRTVGWFTALHPVLLERSAQGLLGTLSSVSRRLQAVPHNGIGYGVLRYLAGDERSRRELASFPPAEISFLFLGHRSSRKAGPLVPIEPLGMLRSPRARLPHTLSVHAMVIDGRLQVHWVYSHLRHLEETIRRLSSTYVQVASEMVANLQSGGTTSVSAADVLAFGWSEADLRGIEAAIRGGSADQ